MVTFVEVGSTEANSHMPRRAHTVPMPLPYRAHAIPYHVNSHIPCRAPAILRQCCVLRESPRGSRKYPNCSVTDWNASGKNLRGIPRGSTKKPNAGRSPTCRLWTADANSDKPCHAPCSAHAALCRGIKKSLSDWHGLGMSTAWARHGIYDSNTAALCKSNGKDTI
jgi:hypothetical protein